jgi:hypothetical protein
MEPMKGGGGEREREEERRTRSSGGSVETYSASACILRQPNNDFTFSRPLARKCARSSHAVVWSNVAPHRGHVNSNAASGAEIEHPQLYANASSACVLTVPTLVEREEELLISN